MKKILILRRPRSGRLEGPTTPIQVPSSVQSVSAVADPLHGCAQSRLWAMIRAWPGHPRDAAHALPASVDARHKAGDEIILRRKHLNASEHQGAGRRPRV